MFWNKKNKEYNKIEEFVEPKKNYSEILDLPVNIFPSTNTRA